MQTLLEINQVSLQVVTAYIAHIKSLYPDPDDGAERLLLVLRIYRWHIARYHENTAVTFDELMTLKHGIRETELLLEDIFESEPQRLQGWYHGRKPENQAQRLVNLLSELILELTKEIQANEDLFPELKFAFDRERAQYRASLEAAREAEQID